MHGANGNDGQAQTKPQRETRLVAGFFRMLGLQELAALARRELGDQILQKPLRVSCLSCGGFLLQALSAPQMQRTRCRECHIDLVVLVSKRQEVLVTQAT